MAERMGSWPGEPPPPHVPFRPPSGLFPRQPPRPRYREPHPVGSGPVLAGVGAAVVWFALFGSLARDLFSYAWWTLLAAVTAWAVAAVLALLGDRGVAVGVAAASGCGLSIAAMVVAVRWITTGDWPMW